MSNEDIKRDDDNWPLPEELEDAYRSTEGLENANGSGNAQPADQQPDIPSEPSGGDSEEGRSMADTECIGDAGRERDRTEQGERTSSNPEQCNKEVADTKGSDIKSNNEGQGQGESGRCDNGTQFGTGEKGNDTSERQSGQGESEIESQVGGNSDGITIGMVLSEYSGLSYQELEEIFDWMCSGTSRVEELRLLGNGVVPQCAEKAFRTLYARLDKAL